MNDFEKWWLTIESEFSRPVPLTKDVARRAWEAAWNEGYEYGKAVITSGRNREI